MVEHPLQDREAYLRAIRARMMHQSSDLSKTIMRERPSFVRRTTSFGMPLKSPLPEDVLRVVEHPNDARRLRRSEGPLIAFRKGKEGRGLIELATLFLNPELRVRRAAIAELGRQLGQHQPFLSPETRKRCEDLRDAVLMDDAEDSLEASVAIHDCLRDDYFYQLAGLRQCAELRVDEEVRGYLPVAPRST